MLNIFSLAIVCALAIGQPAGNASPASRWSLAAVALSTSLPILLALGISRRCQNRKSDGRPVNMHRWLDLHMICWAVSAIGTIFVARWPAWVHACLFAEAWFLLDQVVILAPLWLSWFVSWMVFSRLFGPLENDASEPRARLAPILFALQQSRLTLLLAWAPVLLFSVLHDLLRPWTQQIGETAVPLIIFGINGLLLITIFPKLLTTLWDAQPLPAGPLRERLEEVAQRSGARIHEILCWRTQNRICNAVVTGLWPGTRRIFLSDGLIERFSDEEIEAVFTHELAHVVHRHLMWRTALLLVPVSLMLLVIRFGQHWGLQMSVVGGGVVVALALVYLIVSLGWYSRRLEHQADLWACRRLARGSSRATALQRYLSVLWRMELQHSHRGSWMHPSYRRRRDFLVSSLTVRSQADAFEREMRWFAGMLAVFTLLPLLAIL